MRGPVCILAGAGSGKTTTITRRIALQVATGTFAPGSVLAVTFTDKAAREMASRLNELGVRGVRTRTFHATALAQLRALVPELGEILPSKALWVRQIANALPGAYRFRAAADLATEIEWARNRRLTPDTYLGGLGDHEPPLPPDLMLRVFRRYEERKRRERRIDFEDVLELLVRAYTERPEAIARFRDRCLAITVDEYQDVNLLQQTLLDLWLGERDELCVVGDDYQAIYSFTGATPRWLLDVAKRFPHAPVIRLEENYRSTPEILGLANRLVSKLGGARKELRAVRPGGPEPVAAPVAGDEAAAVAQRVASLLADGVAAEEIAILYRVNARSEDFEEALAASGIPYQVRGAAFLSRPAARSLLRALRRLASEPAGPAVEAVARAAGLDDSLPEGAGDEEATRQADLRRLVQLAGGFDGDVAAFTADLERRFGEEGDARGVHLLTYHRAKGLEWDAVFLPFLVEGDLPWRQAKSAEAVAEERRLLYVGITRARRHLFLSWSATARPSRFLVELGVSGSSPATASRPRRPVAVDPGAGDALDALRAWRRARARADRVPAYVVFHDTTLEEVAARLPASPAELLSCPGVGPTKLERYGDEMLAALAPFR